ncbi:MAG: YodL domain-containing protein [Oscillospiraceae bacterium]|nr:YodL domain-containing protein [Oscillospiraceae bacterium]
MPEKESYAEQNKARLKEITDSIETNIKDLFQSDRYMQYLRTMSRFHKYSVNNTMLIYMQRPDATLVAGFNKWRDQFERNVVKGEKGIKIIAPTPYKKKIEEMKRDPDTNAPILDADGNAVMEEKTIQIPMYKVVSVFDVSQTDGKPLPELAANLTGNVENYEVFMEALRRSAPVPIAFEPMAADMDGYFSNTDQRIAIREGMSEVQTVSAAVHEIAHSKLHNRELPQPTEEVTNSDSPVPKPKSRETKEVEAESISYAVCAYYGIATGENSFGYIATWSKNKELPELRASLDTINKTASGLISDIDRNYREICKERGLDKAKPEQQPGYEEWSEPATPENAPLTPDVPSDQVSDYLPETPPAKPEQSDDNRILSVTVEEAKPKSNAEPYRGVMPDPALSIAAMNAYGYLDNDMLPLSKERALELFERDVSVYMLYAGNGAGMAFEAEDIEKHTGIFGVDRKEWIQVRDAIPPMDAAEAQKRLEQTFLQNEKDSFAIYQLKSGDETRNLRFESMEAVKAAGLTVQPENYNLVYTDRFAKFDGTQNRLEKLYDRFNNDHPEDFRGHSLSVSDIIALKQGGDVSYHYVDSADFVALPDFKKPENYLKNAEMALEDDYGMIDGVVNNGPKQPTVAELEQQAKSGQPISLMELAEAQRRERQAERKQEQRAKQMPQKKPSLLAQLRAPLPERNKNAVQKTKEREM